MTTLPTSHKNEVRKPVDGRESLVQIVKLQAMLNSKMFEFMRSYQKQSHWGSDGGFFRDGSGNKTKTAQLFEEVNEIGCALSRVVSEFIGEDIYERRDEEGRVLAFCRHCEKESPFVRVVNSPYGLSDAYIDGTERLVCAVCGKDTIYPGDDRLPKFNSIFRTK